MKNGMELAELKIQQHAVWTNNRVDTYATVRIEKGWN